MKPSFLPNLLTTCLLPLCSVAYAAENKQIVTDRPDFVESSNVVGKGRFQIETGIAHERNNANGIKHQAYMTPTLLRFGVTESFELRLETDGRVIARSEDTIAASTNKQHGFADVSLGAKWHVLDAEGNMPSIGILGHVDIDSGTAQFRGDGIRPSLRVSAEWDLPNDMSLGIMPGMVYDRNATGKRFAGGILGIVLGKSWTDRFYTFTEIAASQIASTEHGGNIASFDVGLAYKLSDLLQIDTAIYKGLNKNTADLTVGIGISAKF